MSSAGENKEKIVQKHTQKTAFGFGIRQSTLVVFNSTGANYSVLWSYESVVRANKEGINFTPCVMSLADGVELTVQGFERKHKKEWLERAKEKSLAWHEAVEHQDISEFICRL